MSANKHTRRKLVWAFLFSALSLYMTAGKIYWIATSSANWNTAANWSATSGGGSGSLLPTNTDTCYFDGGTSGTCIGNCTINTNVNVKRFEIQSGYTGTITQGTNTITVGTGGMKLAGAAVFTGGSASITINSTFENTACNFTATSGTMEILEGHFLLTGTGAFLHNNGLLKLNHSSGSTVDSCRINLGTSSNDSSFYDLELTGSAGKSRYYKLVTGSILVNHTFTVSGSGNKYCPTGIIKLLGDFTISGTGFFGYGAGSVGTLKFAGTGSQTINGGGSTTTPQVLNVDIDKSPGSTLYFSGVLCTWNSFKLTNGNLNAGTSKVYYSDIATAQITGNFTGSNAFNKLYLSPSAGTLVIDDTLQVNDSLVLHVSSGFLGKGTHAGILNAKGSITFKNDTYFEGTGTLMISGSGTQVFRTARVLSTNISAGVPNLLIRKLHTDTLKLIGNFVAWTSWTCDSGYVESSGAHIIFPSVRSTTVTGSHSLSRVEFQMYNNVAVTIASGTQLDILDSMIITTNTSSASGTNISTGTINLRGHLVIKSTSPNNPGTATLKINGTGDQNITGYTASGTFGRLPNVVIDKSSGTLHLYNTICTGSTGTATNFTLDNGVIDYGSSTLLFANNCTITSNKTGNRFDIGNMQVTTGTVTVASSTTLVVNKDFSTTASSSALKINGGTLKCRGNITILNTNTSLSSVGTVAMIIDSSLNQTFTGNGLSGAGFLPKITINKSGGKLTLASTISAGDDWTYTAGTVDAATSKVYFGGTHNIDAQGTSSTMSFYNATFGGTSTLTGDMKITNNLRIDSAKTLSQSTYGLSFGGYDNYKGTHSGSGPVTMIGNGYHTFKKTTSATVNFGTVTVNRSGGSLALNSPINVTGSMTFTKGIIKTSSTNLLKFADNATCSGGSDSGYVMGPIIKTGNDSITFPLGDSSNTYDPYRPISITAPSNTTDAFTASYYHSPAPNPNDLPDTIQGISNCEYWTLKRNTGSSNVKTAVWWSEKDCPVYANDAVEIANYDSTVTKWVPIGGNIIDNDTLDGLMRIISPNNVSFTLTGPILIALAKKITPGYPQVERSYTSQYYLTTGKVLNFEYYEDYNDTDQKLTYSIKRLSNNKTELSQSGYALTVVPGTNRYTMNLNTILPGTFTSGYYLLEITNEKQEKFYLRFKI